MSGSPDASGYRPDLRAGELARSPERAGTAVRYVVLRVTAQTS